MPRLDGSQLIPAPDYLSERAAEDSAQEAALRAYLLTPAGHAALLAGKLDEWIDDRLEDDEPVTE